MILSLWLACTHTPQTADSFPVDTDSDTDTDADSDSDSDSDLVDHCGEVEGFGPNYLDTILQWVEQDMLDPWPPGGLVFTGSSSIRRWEGLAAAYSDYHPIQRGFGGAQAGEVALLAHDLVARHDPAGVVVFAGTNDIAAGVSAEITAERLRCLRQRLPDLPMLFIGITPTPARWDQWEAARAVNDAIADEASSDPLLTYVDVPAAFLQTGSPPSAHLFVDDLLHLSDDGYALWDSVLRPAVEAAVEAAVLPAPAALPAGARILVDLGPSNAEDGLVVDTDASGHRWNRWHDRSGGEAVLPGEHLGGLLTDGGTETGVGLVISGGFYVNGLRNGGLTAPSSTLLGDLAVSAATSDFFYSVPDDATGGLCFQGLSPEQAYTLQLFGARDDGEVRISRYTISGASQTSATLQTSGAGAGSGNSNDDTVITESGLVPDAQGRLFIDLSIEAGSYGYLSLVALTAE